MTSLVDRVWYGKGRPLGWLAPLAWLYRTIADSRRRKAWELRDEPLPVPVVVVGNITAGGTGKSPLTARLVKEMSASGWRPVILSRGYGGKSAHYPLVVDGDSDPSVAGDEPVMLAQATGVPVVVDPQRRRGAAFAVTRFLGNVLICDDGLQHYALPRDIELAVFDASRGIGNGGLIPVGPLREPVSRLSSVDFVVVNGAIAEEAEERLENFEGVEHPDIFPMRLLPSTLVQVATGHQVSLAEIAGRKVHGIAGIGNPARFFATLRQLGAQVRETPFPDHHRFRVRDLSAERGEWLVMTAKDAVKCRKFAPDNAWYLAVEAELPNSFTEAFLHRLEECSQQLNESNQKRTDHG
ncbi:MAG: tetraacyldisaccharide 4'-kinase [Marinobacter sp.]|uniref:tetraacyldisaccharide 4'-kinase n=1 Tax=Marinobacter sp. TaxID=50741 RepID=UPI00396DCCA5